MSTGGLTCERINGDLIAVAMTLNCGLTCCSNSCCCNILADTFGESIHQKRNFVTQHQLKKMKRSKVFDSSLCSNFIFISFYIFFQFFALFESHSKISFTIIEVLLLLWNLFLDNASRKNLQASSIKISQEKTPRCCLLSRRLTS